MNIRKIISGASAAIIAAMVAASASQVSAADLGYSLKDQPYDDPRYSDIYRHPAPPPPPVYAQPYPPPRIYHAPPPHVYAAPPPPPPQPYYRYDGRYGGDCLPRDTICARLEHRGWFDFQDPQVSGNVVHIKARRDSGRLYDLTIDRCSGQVMGAEIVHDRSAHAPPLAPMPPPNWRYRGY